MTARVRGIGSAWKPQTHTAVMTAAMTYDVVYLRDAGGARLVYA